MSEVFKAAKISECGLYRYSLTRNWGQSANRALFVMLNPSTADADKDDATIRSLIRLSKRWGLCGFDVVNLFAYRATDPKELIKAQDPVGPDNDAMIARHAAKAKEIICGWGAHKMAHSRGKRVFDLLSEKPAWCLGRTKSGAPRHPLYVKTDVQLERYP